MSTTRASGFLGYFTNSIPAPVSIPEPTPDLDANVAARWQG